MAGGSVIDAGSGGDTSERAKVATTLCIASDLPEGEEESVEVRVRPIEPDSTRINDVNVNDVAEIVALVRAAG